MNLVVLLVPLTLFLWLQAVYWFFASRRAARDALLAERLGTDESFSQTQALLRQEHEGAFAQRVADMLEAAGEDPNVTAFLGRLMLFFFVTFGVMLVVTGSPAGAVLFGLCGMVIPYILLMAKRRKRLRRIEEQLPEALEVMTISLRAGQSLDQTIRHTAQELEAPIGEEFRRIAEEQDLGRPLDEALLSMAERLKECRTVRTFVVSVLVLRQTGGNLIEVLESIIDTMRQQFQYERKLDAMTAEGRSSSRMLAALPPAFVGLTSIADSSYIGTLFYDPVGQSMLMISAGLYLAGLFWVRKLVKPKT